MKSEGRLYITVPAHQYLWSWRDVYNGHFRRYSLASLAMLLKKSGFKVNYVSYFFSGLSLPIFFFRTLPTLFNLPQDKSPEKRVKTHRKRTGPARKIFDWYWRREIRRLKTGKLSHGSSVIVVAEPVKY